MRIKMKLRKTFKLNENNFYAFFIRKKENPSLWIAEINRYGTEAAYNDEGKCLFYKNYAGNVLVPSLNEDTRFDIEGYIGYNHI